MTPIRMTEASYRALLADDCGVCLQCGDTSRAMTEPDAEGYDCPACGALAVMGCELAMVAGHVQVEASHV